MDVIEALEEECVSNRLPANLSPARHIIYRVSKAGSQVKNRIRPQPVYEKYGDVWISMEPLSRSVSHLRLHLLPPPSTWYYQVTIKTAGLRNKRAFMSASLTSPSLSEMKAIKRFLVCQGFKSAFYQRLTEEGFRDVIIYG